MEAYTELLRVTLRLYFRTC